MTKSITRHGVLVGNGAALNVELGFIPHSVDLFNATDGTLVTTGFLIPWVVPFSGGGLNATSGLNVETVAGSTIRGVTSGATAQVTTVQLYSGSFAAGDAAGFMTLQEGSLVGTFQGEDIVVTNPTSGTVTTATGGDATVTANVVHNLAVAAAAAGATGTSAISRYAGTTGSASQGFTVGSVLAVEAKVLRYRAFRDDF